MPNKSMTWGAVATSLDISRLNDLGICVSQDNEILYNEQFDYYIIKFYANYGTGQVSVDTSNFYITKGYPLDVTTNQHGYLSQNQSGVNIQRGASGPLVTYGGEHILYNPDATYTISTIDNTSHQSIDTTHFSIVEYSGNVGLHLSENSPVQVYNNVQHVEFSVTVHNRIGDEVTINADLPYTTSVTSYKLRLADKYPDAVWLYFTSDKSDELIFEDTPMPLYKSDGTLATRTDYGDYELEALEPIPPYVNNDGYCRFSNAVFSYATYNSTSDVLHVSFSDLHQGSEDDVCITNRLRVNIAAPTTQTAQLGGVITSTADSVISVPIEQIGGSVAFYGYAYQDGSLLNMSWNFGGVIEVYSPAPVFPLDLTVGMSINNSTGDLIAVTFDYPLEENYWNTRVKSAVDKELLRNLGLWVDYPEFLYGSVLNASSYQYEIIEIYTGIGEDVAPFDLSDFYIPDYQKLSLGCTSSYSTPVKSWKLRITPISPVVMPTVSMSYAYPNQLWNYSVNIGAGASSVLRDQNGNALSYDSTKSYSALNYYTSTSDSAGTIDTNVSIGASGSFLALFNNGSSQITVQRVNVATCDSPSATVITVYDSNNPYNAFKYTLNGTDYYYVLDGTQTDWTDDLESIGYHIPVLVTSYLTNLGASATTNFGLGTNSVYQLYDSSGSMLLYDSTKTYSIISANRINSQYPDWSSSDLQSLSIGHYSDYLHLVTGNNIPYQNGIYSVTYTVL